MGHKGVSEMLGGASVRHCSLCRIYTTGVQKGISNAVWDGKKRGGGL